MAACGTMAQSHHTLQENHIWELENIRSALSTVGTLPGPSRKRVAVPRRRNSSNGTDTARKRPGSMVVLPHAAGLSENLARIYKRHDISLI